MHLVPVSHLMPIIINSFPKYIVAMSCSKLRSCSLMPSLYSLAAAVKRLLQGYEWNAASVVVSTEDADLRRLLHLLRAEAAPDLTDVHTLPQLLLPDSNATFASRYAREANTSVGDAILSWVHLYIPVCVVGLTRRWRVYFGLNKAHKEHSGHHQP